MYHSHNSRNCQRLMFVFVWTLLGYAAVAHGQTPPPETSIHIAIGNAPSDLESFAASELKGLLSKLFCATVTIGNVPAINTQSNILLAEQARLREFAGLGNELPNLNAQDHAIKSAKFGTQSALVVTGGSPTATLWAAYELGWQYGVRYFLFGDLYPASPSKFSVEAHDHLFRTQVRNRTWIAFSPSLAGSSSWGFDEHKKILGQLAKLKYNRVVASPADLQRYVSSIQPLVVSGDTQGRSVFSGAKLFDNPDLLGSANAKERSAAAESLVTKILAEAQRIGMSTDRSVNAQLQADVLAGTLLPTSRFTTWTQSLEKGVNSELTLQVINPNDLAPEAIFLARAAFDPKLTADQYQIELLDSVCGEGVASRLSKAIGLWTQATELAIQNDPNLGLQSADKWNQIFSADEPVPAWWLAVRDHYLNAMNEMYRANTRAREGGRQYTLYFARRFEFGFEYMNAMEAVRKAGIASRAKKSDEAIAELEKALDSITGACNAMAAVARSNSDRGVIALMNEFAFRPVTKLLESTESQ